MASSRSDQELLDLWCSGDQAASDELHERYYDMLLDFFASTGTGAKTKVELVVDTFIACRDERSQIVPNLGLGVHLLNLAGRVLRGSRAREWRLGSSVSSSSRIEQAMRLVSVENRKLIELHDFKSLSEDKIARRLRIPVTDVPRRLNRARRQLEAVMSYLPVEDLKLTRPPQRIQIALQGDIEQLDPDTFRRILEEAREKSGDPALSITSIRKGSILLELDISAEAAAMLEKLFESGDLKSLGGLPIRAIKRVRAELPDMKSAAIFEGAEMALADFFVDAFAADELRRFVHGFPGGVQLAAALPGSTASLSHLAFEVVRVLARHGLVSAELFDRLTAERPHRRDAIRRLRQRFEHTADAG